MAGSSYESQPSSKSSGTTGSSGGTFLFPGEDPGAVSTVPSGEGFAIRLTDASGMESCLLPKKSAIKNLSIKKLHRQQSVASAKDWKVLSFMTRRLVTPEDDDRVQITILPSHGKVSSEILDYCREEGIGIVVVGHSPPTGIKGYFQGSVTKKILADVRNMTVWVTQ